VKRVKLHVLPVVKAYPEPSTKYGETVCVAGVTIPDCRWIRLYPIRFTNYPKEKQFSKYQPFEVMAVKSADPRPESHKIDEDTIEITGDVVDTRYAWSERKRLLADAQVSSLCDLQYLQKREGKSLGMIRVAEVTGFDTAPTDEEKYFRSENKRDYAATADLFLERKLRVEALPFKYRYTFRCTNPSCKGHRCSIIDWEAYELHRKMRRQWGDEGAVEKVRQMYADYICGPDKDTYFFMGNMQAHPGSFLVLGAFYPPLSGSPTLFEFQRMKPVEREAMSKGGASTLLPPTLFPESGENSW
jgi:hypothetical protein